ncbi:Fe-S protein assembly co-chaperone HscB [Curvibacter sp. APW13]|uniref:Fe-S protein assembly co-chaperone HscB n=1 Tax=Curvibacter sp. APW13 TaxID=3077236 RepID=UPI0028DF2173|nr:Fe-S protein assembly co-chaperone HscB [Curvibacter sp. APW13]MDT8991466.1 Fe-S protein assembly co-chaperone HscB [Curvibacter sp. APW13]
MNLQSDDFTLFGLQRSFQQDAARIDASWKDLQRQAHPDRFVSEGASAQRLAMQWSVRINEAHQRLKDPVKRAALLCELGGHPIAAHTNTAMPAAFLMQQMEWREALEEADSLEAVEALHDEVRAFHQSQIAQLQTLIDERQDYASAAQVVRGLMFVEKFLLDMDAVFERYE